jgi:hypothetical protein
LEISAAVVRSISSISRVAPFEFGHAHQFVAPVPQVAVKIAWQPAGGFVVRDFLN